MIDDYVREAVGGMRIGKENRDTRRISSQRLFVHHKSHMIYLGSNPGLRLEKPATNRLTYGTTPIVSFITCG
jgi:hypothetical protein